MLRFNSLFIAILVSIPAAAQDPGAGTWATRSPSAINGESIGHFMHAAAEAGGSLYVFGGLSIVGGAWVYDHINMKYSPLTDTWELKAPIAPTGSLTYIGWSGSGSCSFGGSVYQFGGTRWSDVDEGTIDASCWRYDPAIDAWSQATDLPEARYAAKAAATATRIYVMGGSSVAVSSTTTNYEFDPQAGTWTTRAPIPQPKSGHTLGAINGDIYLAGGQAGFEFLNARRYSPSTDTWTLITPTMPQPRENGTGAVVNGRFYVIGGTTIGGSSGLPMEFNPATSTWASCNSGTGSSAAYAASAVAMRAGQPRVYILPNTALYEFTPPLPPDVPTTLFMHQPGGVDLVEGSWINGTVIEVGAAISDPNLPQQVRLETEVVPTASPFTGVGTKLSALVPSAVPAPVVFTSWTLAAGSFKWRARTLDSLNGASAWIEFGAPGVTDVSIDQSPPSIPVPLTPVAGEVIEVTGDGAYVTFTWGAATDNNPNPISYEVSITGAAPMVVSSSTTDATVWLPTSKLVYGWRVGAIDGAGNGGLYSAIVPFHVIRKDGIDNGSGDAKQACGMSAPSAGGSLFALILLLGFVRRR